ncbi:MAG: hypothetical protein LBD80_04620 [Tannerella sp.]|jgi:Spy/CpxP family protein refolding chaperone|nr:hypothetical protein [Tannerella sp.]
MKKTSLFLIITIITASFGNSVYSQKENRRHGDIYPLDIKGFIEKRNMYLTEKLSLTTEEAAKFLPVDNELMRKKFEAGRNCHQLGRKIHEKKDRSEEAYAALLKCREEAKAKRFELEKKYMEKFKDILSCEQIIIYERATKDFLDEYMKNKK